LREGKTISHPSHRFRTRLREELARWRHEGLVDEEAGAALTERYRLNDLGAEAQGLLLTTIVLIGVALIGCGIVAFVAAHWDSINKYVKVATLIVAMTVAHVGGYYVWRVRRPAWPRIGHGLTVLGTVIFGANIGLFAQIFHISENWHNGFMAWALGAVLVGYALKSVPNMVIGAVMSFVWYCGRVGSTDSAFFIYPLLAAGVFLPACYAWRSTALFTLTVLAITASLIGNGGVYVDESAAAAAILTVLPLVALWLYGKVHDREGRWAAFGVVAGILAATGLSLIAYIGSFLDVADEVAYYGRDRLQAAMMDGRMICAVVMILVLGAAMAVLAGLRRRPGRVPRVLVPCLIGMGLAGPALFVESDVWMAVSYNTAAVVMAGYGIVVGLTHYRRRQYWGGLVLIVLLIASRFFEYESHLLVKSGGFIAAGLVLILAGVQFERRMRTRRAAEEAADA
jgi:uncharacterized membrane protein